MKRSTIERSEKLLTSFHKIGVLIGNDCLKITINYKITPTGQNNTSRVPLIIPTRIIFIVVVASFSFIRLRSTEVVEQRYLHDQRLQNHNST